MILLKAGSLTSKEVARQVGCCEVVVNNWLKRYQEEGMDGLKVRQGRGRHMILQAETDFASGNRFCYRSSSRSRASTKSKSCQGRIESGVRKRLLGCNFEAILKKNGCRFMRKLRFAFKRIRRRVKSRPLPEILAAKKEDLAEFEKLSEQGRIDLFYGDESGVSLAPCIPYAWQFADEKLCLPCCPGGNISCFALINRDCQCFAELSRQPITADWMRDYLERFSFEVRRATVIVLDNARIHTARILKERFAVWQERGLFVFFLPPYSPELNIDEILWRKLKYEWLTVKDYSDKKTLYFAVWKALRAVGKSLNINFGKFQTV